MAQIANMAVGGGNIKLNPVGVAIIVVLTVCGLYYAGVPGWLRQDPKVNMKELLSVCIEVAKRGGDRVKAVHESAKLDAEEKGKTKEGKAELKTNGDMQSHRAMMYGIIKAFPQLKVISEEHDTVKVNLNDVVMPSKTNAEVVDLDAGEDIPASDIAVWIDPLDATQEYSEGTQQPDLLKFVTTMVCVAVRGKPVIGVIHKPFSQETAWGFDGVGQSKSLKPASDNKHVEGKPYKIIVSRSHSGKVQPVLQDSLGKDTEVVPAGGAGYKTLEVVNGEDSAYVHVTRIKKWDICAGNAILNTVGGTMTTLHGDVIDYSAAGDYAMDNGLLAALSDQEKLLKAIEPKFDELRKKDN